MRGFEQGRIIERTDITHDLAVFRIETDHPIEFIPGQFVRLGLEIEGRLLQRSYSIVSAPGERYLEFLLELVPEGLLTPHLWKLGAGDTIMIHSTASGVFTLDREGGFARHLLVASVTGIAPYISMLRDHANALERGERGDLRFILIHEAERSAGLEYYRPELERYAAAGWLLYVPTISQPWEEESWEGETGKGEDLIRKYADAAGFDHISAKAYVCGHPLLVESGKEIFRRGRFPKGGIATEKYFTIRSAPSERKGTLSGTAPGRRNPPPQS